MKRLYIFKFHLVRVLRRILFCRIDLFQHDFYQPRNPIVFYLTFPDPDVIIRKWRTTFCFQEIEIGKKDAMSQYVLDIFCQQNRILHERRQLLDIRNIIRLP